MMIRELARFRARYVARDCRRIRRRKWFDRTINAEAAGSDVDKCLLAIMCKPTKQCRKGVAADTIKAVGVIAFAAEMVGP